MRVNCETELGITETLGSAEQRIKWFGTARGRLGWANDGWLLYVTGGAAWAGIDATTTFSETILGTPFAAGTKTTSFTKTGAVIGGGAEFKLAGPWTAKVEYLFMNFGSISDTLGPLPPPVPITVTTNSTIYDHVVRVGLNYKFNQSVGAPELPALPYKAPPAPAAGPAYDWSGFYIGANASYGVGADPFNQTFTEFGVPAISSIDSRVTPQGGLFGGQLGYNVQSGHLVFGVEGDMQWADQHDTAGCGILCVTEPFITQTVGSAEQRIKWFGTARGRVGWANDGWLFYITGGAAWAGIDATTAFSVTGGGTGSNTTSFTTTGAVVGGGAELRLAGPWTAKVEYLFMDLGSISDTLTGAPFLVPATLTTNSTIYDHVVRVGLNYKFNWSGPLSTRD